MDFESTNEDLLALEQTLKSRLHPIQADQKFVGSLRSRLEEATIYQQQRETAYSLLLVASGLLVGMTVFLIGKGILQN